MSYHEELAERLLEVREEVAELGARGFARALAEEGHEVTHNAVLNRETGAVRNVPAGYLATICERWGIHPVWLLMGRGRRSWGDRTEVERDRLAAADWMERLARDLREEER